MVPHISIVYVVECLHSARGALQEDSYEGVVKAAVALGADADTTAAVAGGIAGVRWGFHAIPVRWRDGLRGSGIYEPLLAQLVRISKPWGWGAAAIAVFVIGSRIRMASPRPATTQ